MGIEPEVVRRPQGQMVVGPAVERFHRCGEKTAALFWWHQQGDGQAGDSNVAEQVGHQAADPALVEATELLPEGLLLVVQQRTADDVPGDDKKDIHTGEATGQPTLIEVISKDRQDRDAAQSIDIRSITPRGQARAALGGCGAGADQRRIPSIKG